MSVHQICNCLAGALKFRVAPFKRRVPLALLARKRSQIIGKDRFCQQPLCAGVEIYVTPEQQNCFT